MEDLEFSGAVDREVIDGFVSDWIVGNVRSLREHALHGSRVGGCERLALRIGILAWASRRSRLKAHREHAGKGKIQRVVIIFGNHSGSLQD